MTGISFKVGKIDLKNNLKTIKLTFIILTLNPQHLDGQITLITGKVI